MRMALLTAWFTLATLFGPVPCCCRPVAASPPTTYESKSCALCCEKCQPAPAQPQPAPAPVKCPCEVAASHARDLAVPETSAAADPGALRWLSIDDGSPLVTPHAVTLLTAVNGARCGDAVAPRLAGRSLLAAYSTLRC